MFLFCVVQHKAMSSVISQWYKMSTFVLFSIHDLLEIYTFSTFPKKKAMLLSGLFDSSQLVEKTKQTCPQWCTGLNLELD